MNKLQEIFVMGKPNIVSERKRPSGDTMTVVVPFVQADKKNSNGRTYPLALLKREVSRIQGAVERHSMIGTGDHPVSGFPDIATSSHILQKVWLDNEGKGYAQMKIIPTPRGKTIQTLINHGAELGVSSRGYGNVSDAGIVQNDYKLTGIDIVQNPSYKEGVFNKSDVFESLNLEEESLDAQGQKDLEEAVNELEKESYLSAVELGFKGSQEEWVAEYGGNLRKMVGLPVEEGKTTTEKLTEEEVNKRIYSYYQEAVQGGFIGSIDEWKKQFPRLVEQASERVTLSEKKEPKEKFKAKMPWSEIVASGWKGTIKEYREKYPEVELVLPTPPQKPIVETLEQEAQRIFEGLKKTNPDSSVTLESVKGMLEKEELAKEDKRIRRKAIATIARESDGSASQKKLEQMVAEEVKALKKQREEMREKNWQAYKRLLD